VFSWICSGTKKANSAFLVRDGKSTLHAKCDVKGAGTGRSA
jgi:hypothetical protein